MDTQHYNFGMIGLGVMGRNFLLNMADHQFPVIGFDKDITKAAALEADATPGTIVKGVTTLQEMVHLLAPPRRIMMLVPAGKPVDDVIESLLPLLKAGDIIIDGGNSHFADTTRRIEYLKQKQLHFMGMGVSGGEQGARLGPSIMPGGDVEAWEHVKPMLEAVAAKVEGEPCVAYMGKHAAGHYVKMVHNGIEYAIMQLICESYDVLRHAGYSNEKLHQLFKQWNEGELQSFLIEITRDIFLQKDDITGKHLVDVILDKAGAKGTGKWTSQDALDLGVPIPTIDMAVTMRNISALKNERTELAAKYKKPAAAITTTAALEHQVHDALYLGMLAAYTQGLALLQKASVEHGMQIHLQQTVQVWRGGCIIRSAMLQLLYRVMQRNNTIANILHDDEVAAIANTKLNNLRHIVTTAIHAGLPTNALNTVLGYIDAYATAQLPTNLLQAQRDFFGAHTYERIDKEGKFHTEWGE
jgi:6-phosphogluconate dehydrogenase